MSRLWYIIARYSPADLAYSCTGGFNAGFVSSAMNMICSYDGIFGYVGSSKEFIGQPRPSSPLSASLGALMERLSIPELSLAYKQGLITPIDVANAVSEKTVTYQAKDAAVWIHLDDRDALVTSAKAIQARFSGQPLPPLYGIPFAVKDNIDVAGFRTTVAAEVYAYMAESNAVVVDALLKTGALFVGKTNMDQLATGLSGCRSPFGTPKSVCSTDRISGGSSSGSGVAVGAHLVSFALGTDTAGSGRILAAFNDVVGYKSTKGTPSSKGLVPACKSLDTISIFAQTVDEARAVWLTADQGPDVDDAYAKPLASLPTWQADFRGRRTGGFTFEVPPTSIIEATCTKTYQRLFAEAVSKLEICGGRAKEVLWSPFAGATNLLYNGSLILERVACLDPDFLIKNMEELHSVIQALLMAAMKMETSPWVVSQDQDRQRQYIQQSAKIFHSIETAKQRLWGTEKVQ